jgi:hypothetical protein
VPWYISGDSSGIFEVTSLVRVHNNNQISDDYKMSPYIIQLDSI